MNGRRRQDPPASGAGAEVLWRTLLYAALLLAYLAGDAFVFHGPIRRKIEARFASSHLSRERAIARGWVATVNGEPVTSGQLDRAVSLYLFRRARRDPETLPEFDRRIARRAALQGLIVETLVRQYTAADGYEAGPEAVRKHIERFEAQFAAGEELEERSARQGLTPEQRNRMLTEHLSQERWIEKMIEPAARVTEAEMRECFDKNRAADAPGFTNPELVRACHIFLSTVEEDTPEREAQIREIHRRLAAEGADFAALAAETSEDERTKKRGGDLDWFSRERMPEDFCDVVFSLPRGTLSEPFRTSLGWHIVQVTGRQAARPLTFEELEPEIRALLETERRRYAVETLLHKLQIASTIEVFPENIDSPKSMLETGAGSPENARDGDFQ